MRPLVTLTFLLVLLALLLVSVSLILRSSTLGSSSKIIQKNNVETFDDSNIGNISTGPAVSLDGQSGAKLVPCEIYYTKMVEQCDAGVFNSNILVYKELMREAEDSWSGLSTEQKLDYIGTSNVYHEMQQMQAKGLNNGCKVTFPSAWSQISFAKNQLQSDTNKEPTQCYISLNELSGSSTADKMSTLNSYITDTTNQITFFDISHSPDMFHNGLFPNSPARVQFKDKALSTVANGLYCNLPAVEALQVDSNQAFLVQTATLVPGTLRTLSCTDLHMERPLGQRQSVQMLVGLLRGCFQYFLNGLQLAFVPNSTISTQMQFVINNPCQKFQSVRQKTSSMSIVHSIPLFTFLSTTDLVFGRPDQILEKIRGYFAEIKRYKDLREAARQLAQARLNQYLDILNQLAVKLALQDYQAQLALNASQLPIAPNATAMGSYSALQLVPSLSPLQGQEETVALYAALSNITALKTRIDRMKLLGANANVDWSTPDVPDANTFRQSYFDI